jgi:hypothetical protein
LRRFDYPWQCGVKLANGVNIYTGDAGTHAVEQELDGADDFFQEDSSALLAKWSDAALRAAPQLQQAARPECERASETSTIAESSLDST